MNEWEVEQTQKCTEAFEHFTIRMEFLTESVSDKKTI